MWQNDCDHKIKITRLQSQNYNHKNKITRSWLQDWDPDINKIGIGIAEAEPEAKLHQDQPNLNETKEANSTQPTQMNTNPT